ncbi:MAG TPA: lipoyl synthase [Thermoplasmata archaeon]|nr:lipoyl synthase [Thermoplasmata archaeon]
MSAPGLSVPPAGGTGRLPSWIRVRAPTSPAYALLGQRLREHGLGTVCEEAHCPNRAECWSAGDATVMLLGTDCTRRCGFCAVATKWPRGAVDRSEPDRVARAVAAGGLRHVVLTQVCRDDLPDGGAEILAETVRAIRSAAPGTSVELLIGDLGGSGTALEDVLADPPDVLAHNIETVRRLSPGVRDRRASYDRSLGVLRRARAKDAASLVTKSSIMLGLGESAEELDATFRDLREVGVDLLTLGQYLRPSLDHLPVREFVTPEAFDRLGARALTFGFAGVASGPMVRSSYHAGALFNEARVHRR